MVSSILPAFKSFSYEAPTAQHQHQQHMQQQHPSHHHFIQQQQQQQRSQQMSAGSRSAAFDMMQAAAAAGMLNPRQVSISRNFSPSGDGKSLLHQTFDRKIMGRNSAAPLRTSVNMRTNLDSMPTGLL